MLRKIYRYLLVKFLIFNFILANFYFLAEKNSFTKTVFFFILVGGNTFFIFDLVILKYIKKYRFYLFVNLFFDIFLIIFISFFDGGITKSNVTLLFYLIIIVASIFYYDRGSVLVATIISVSYFVVFYLIFNDIVPAYSNNGVKINFVLTNKTYLSLFITLISFYVIGYIVSNLSIAYSKRGEEFETQRILLEDIFDNIYAAVFVFDKFNKLDKWNKNALELCRWKIKKGDYYKLVLPKGISDIFSEIDGQNQIIEKNIKVESSFFRVVISKMKKRGSDLGKIVMITDITKQKKMEMRIRDLDKISYAAELGAGLAHELRNPLASLYGSIQLLKESSKNNDNIRLYDVVLSEAERLNKLVTDFLNFAGKESVKKGMVDLKNVVEEVVFMIKTVAKRKIEIKCNGSAFMIFIDINSIKQVLNNIIWNAVEATDEENGEIGIKLVEADNCVRIFVHDNGIGIDENDRKEIFNPFYSKKDGGTGLGLAIAKKYVIQNGGRIDFKSKKGIGTVFIFSFPKFKEDDSAYM